MYILIEFKFNKVSVLNILYLLPLLEFCYACFSLNDKKDSLIYKHIQNNGHTIAHPWWSLHKYKCLWEWRARFGIQVSKNEFYTHIHLDYVRVEFLSCIKKKKLMVIKNYYKYKILYIRKNKIKKKNILYNLFVYFMS